MTKVAEEDGYQFHVYPKDHPPPHVHVRCPDGKWVKINLTDGSFMTPPPRGKEGKLRTLFRRFLESIREKWDEYHEEEI